jgi:hypothetical protein
MDIFSRELGTDPESRSGARFTNKSGSGSDLVNEKPSHSTGSIFSTLSNIKYVISAYSYGIFLLYKPFHRKA